MYIVIVTQNARVVNIKGGRFLSRHAFYYTTFDYNPAKQDFIASAISSRSDFICLWQISLRGLRSALQLIFPELEHIEAVVSSLLLKKLEVVAHLDNLTVGKHDNVVRVLNGRKPVRYHKHSADVHHFFKRVLD